MLRGRPSTRSSLPVAQRGQCRSNGLDCFVSDRADMVLLALFAIEAASEAALVLYKLLGEAAFDQETKARLPS